MTWTSVAAGSGPTPHQSNILTGIKVRLGKQPQPLCFCKFPTKGCMQSRFRNSWALYSKIHLWVLQSAHSELVIFFCFSKKKKYFTELQSIRLTPRTTTVPWSNLSHRDAGRTGTVLMLCRTPARRGPTPLWTPSLQVHKFSFHQLNKSDSIWLKPLQ